MPSSGVHAYCLFYLLLHPTVKLISFQMASLKFSYFPYFGECLNTHLTNNSSSNLLNLAIAELMFERPMSTRS